jgi:lipopolysaccharide biosynthesis regulator YciM
MEFESWWLAAIPLFFGLGWAAARVDLRHEPRKRGALPDAYFRGLNFLLNEQPDKAIDAFIDVVKLDPETVELHFALGNLFRRRGESDRAIRVHLNLAERPDLDRSQREHALFELGQDYLKAGLLDRAEDAFNRLDATEYAGAALRHRMDIAQMVRDWPLAIDLAEHLSRETGQSKGHELAHFRCEMALRALQSDAGDRLEQASRELDIAARVAPDQPRPFLMAGELAIEQGDPARAIRLWSALAADHPAYLGLIAPAWLAAHEAVGQAQAGVDALVDAHRRSPSIDTLAAIADAMKQLRGEVAAIAWVRQELDRHPSLLGLERLLALQALGADDEDREQIETGQRVLQQHTQRLARYVCDRCGFKARRHYWQCPGCSRWDSYAPRRIEEMER